MASSSLRDLPGPAERSGIRIRACCVSSSVKRSHARFLTSIRRPKPNRHRRGPQRELSHRRLGTGGLAIIMHTWWLLWASLGVVVLAVPVGKVIGIMDDTVAWGSTQAATHEPLQDPEADPGGISQTTLGKPCVSAVTPITQPLMGSWTGTVIDSGRQQNDPRRPAATTRTSSGIAANVPACITWPPCQIAASREGTQNLPGGAGGPLPGSYLPSLQLDNETANLFRHGNAELVFGVGSASSPTYSNKT